MRKKQPQILVHFHLYYHEQVDYFIDKLKNINGADWELVVTYSQWNDDSADKLKRLNPNIKFIQVENIGYDVWPFIRIIQDTNLECYDYIIKLHTKRKVENLRINKINLKAYGWRNKLVNSILNNPIYFKNLLKKFDKDPKLGMVSSIVTLSLNAWDVYESHLRHEFDQMQIKLHKGMVSMGTMFMARSYIFKPLKQSWLNATYFNDHYCKSGYSFTRSHIYERVLSLLPLSLGFTHKGVSPIFRERMRINIAKALKYPLEWSFCIFRKGEQHRKAMRLFGIEFYIGKPKCVIFEDSKNYE